MSHTLTTLCCSVELDVNKPWVTVIKAHFVELILFSISSVILCIRNDTEKKKIKLYMNATFTRPVFKRSLWLWSTVHMLAQDRLFVLLKPLKRRFSSEGWVRYKMAHTMFNNLLYGAMAGRLCSHHCSTALLLLSLRNCCRCFYYINLSCPPRKLSNKPSKEDHREYWVLK